MIGTGFNRAWNKKKNQILFNPLLFFKGGEKGKSSNWW